MHISSEHVQEAYEALVTKLKKELSEAIEGEDRQRFIRMESEEILMDFIVKHHGKTALMDLAKEIDKVHGEKNNYTLRVDNNYE